MITLQELLDGENFDNLDKTVQGNLKSLCEKMNKVRKAYGKSMIVTSGLRSMKHHLEIYAKKGITDKSKIPMKSRHLSGQAVDIFDKDGSLKAWIKNNIAILEEAGLYMEDFKYTPNWVHFQIVPPKSGSRFFIPA
jgi:uncharacterized protein YcbK (DUF882 family)